MLFNNLLDLVYHSSSALSNNFCDSLLNILGSDTELALPPGDTFNNIEQILIYNLIDYINDKNALIEFKFVKHTNLKIGEFILINKEYDIKFDVCHKLNIYKYLLVVYFLDDNSLIRFFNDAHEISPKKGDIVIFPIAWFFIYKIIKNNPNMNNVYIFNIVLKDF